MISIFKRTHELSNRLTCLAGGSMLALIIAAIPASADSFTYDGANMQTFTAPMDGVYNITAYGASGGSSESFAGGLGAEIGGDFTLTAGEVLGIYVGGQGGSDGFAAGGGGGGTFVVDSMNNPLVVAGGGGGDTYNGAAQGGQVGASNSEGGPAGVTGGGGGGGFSGNGSSAQGSGGQGFPSLAGGPAYSYSGGNGGFGGGGGAAGEGGGGGGGYSGGNGSVDNGGGGGGSFDVGTDQILVADENPGNGFLTITPEVTATPEPGTLLLVGGTFVIAGVGFRRKRKPGQR